MIPFGLAALMTVSLPIARRATKCLVPGASAIYLCNEGAGTTLRDYSGNARDGTLGAAAAAPTWGPTGLTFDGGDKAVLTSANFATAFASALSVTAVVNPTGTTTGGIVEIGRAVGALTLVLRVVSNRGYLYVQDHSTTLTTAAGALPGSTWTDFTATHVWGGAAVAYVDGAQNAASSIASTYTAPGTNTSAIGDYAGFAFTGGIAAILLYPFVLTPTQVAQNHAALKAMLAPRGIALA